MKTRSAKAKGRKAQNHVATRLRAVTGLSEDDIRPQLMGGTGADIILSSRGKEAVPFAIEVKNQESLSIWAAIAQAEAHAKGDQKPLLVFTRNRVGKYYATLDFEHLLELIYGQSSKS